MSLLNAFQMPLILQKRGTSLLKELNPVLGHKDGLSKESPKSLELACCSYRPKILSCLQPEKQRMKRLPFN